MQDKNDAVIPEGKRFYGTVTVSERGQIVIPASARKDFGIRTGDKLLVLGDLEQGIAITTMSMMMKLLSNSETLKNLVESVSAAPKTRPERKTKRDAK